MKVTFASSYDEIKEIANHYSFLNDNAICYRGTSSLLVPSIVEKCTFNSYSDLVTKEHFLLNNFTDNSQLKYEFKEPVAKDWEIRIAAREHGLVSSLMDWSNSLDTALEFAIYRFESKNIELSNLWILNKAGINHLTISAEMEKKNSFQELQSPSIIQFAKYNESTYLRRKFIQGGYFLFQSPQKVIIPLKDNPIFSKLLVHIVIPKNVIPEIRKHIASRINIDLDVCPNFDNSDYALDEKCRYLNRTYCLK